MRKIGYPPLRGARLGVLLAAGILSVDARAESSIEVNVVVDMTPEGRLVPPPSPGHPAFFLALMEGDQELGPQVAGEPPHTPDNLSDLLAAELARRNYQVAAPSPHINAEGRVTYADGTAVTVPAHPKRGQPIQLNADGNVPLTAGMINAADGPYSARRTAGPARGADERPPLAQALRAIDPVHGAVLGGTPSLILVIQWGAANPMMIRRTLVNARDMLGLVGGNTLRNLELDFETAPVVDGARMGRYFVVVTAFDYAPYSQSRKKVQLWQAKMSVPSHGVEFHEVLATLAEAGGPWFGRETTRPKQIILPVTPEGKVEIGPVREMDYRDAAPAQPKGA